MSIPGLPFDHSIAPTVGAPASTDLVVPGITADDELLFVIKHDADGGGAAGLDITDYTVGDGTLTPASIDTSGFLLVVCWTPPTS